MDLARLPLTAREVLQAFTNALEAAGAIIPERRYVHNGTEPVWDGEQLTVGLLGARQGTVGSTITADIHPRAITFAVEWRVVLIRVAPTVSDGPVAVAMPADDELAQSGEEAMRDVGALIKAFAELHLNYTLTSAGEGMALLTCRPLGQQGGLVGTELIFEATAR